MIDTFAHWGWAWMIFGFIVGLVARVIIMMFIED